MTTSDASATGTDLSEALHQHGRLRPLHPALILGSEVMDYQTLDLAVDRFAAALQRDGVRPGTGIALVAQTSFAYCIAFLGAVRAGAVAIPIAPSSTPVVIEASIADARPTHIFVGADFLTALTPAARVGCHVIALETVATGATTLERWLDGGGVPMPWAANADAPFNIIYSSGTTGTPKGIVQSHGMRRMHIARSRAIGYDADTVALLSTPLYSNTTLVALLPTLAVGGTAVLMRKFDAGSFLDQSERHRVTHAALVPVQYRRILDHPDFDSHDLSSYRLKTSTSAPFSQTDKLEVLHRWPGGLLEMYGMTEGGGATMLLAHLRPDKLHTVGIPMEGHEFKVIDEEGREIDYHATGEIVGRSPGMMEQYLNHPDLTREAEWYDGDGRRFIRTGDVGRFDDDGFLILTDRKKDMIISGGFNIYPSDLEAALLEHPSVAQASVVGVPSERWGETPVAFVVPAVGATSTTTEVKDWLANKVSATQRLHDMIFVPELPYNAIGKVLKRELRESYVAGTAPINTAGYRQSGST